MQIAQQRQRDPILERYVARRAQAQQDSDQEAFPPAVFAFSNITIRIGEYLNRRIEGNPAELLDQLKRAYSRIAGWLELRTDRERRDIYEVYINLKIELLNLLRPATAR
jgi:hypothetical protein